MGNAPEEEHPHADHAAGVTAVPASDNAPPSLGTSSQSVAPAEEDQQVATTKKDIPPPSCMTLSSQAAIRGSLTWSVLRALDSCLVVAVLQLHSSNYITM